MTIPLGHLVAPVTLVDLPANPATPGGNPGENFPAGPDRDGSWVPGLPFQVRIVMKEIYLDLSTKVCVTSILITIGFSPPSAFYVLYTKLLTFKFAIDLLRDDAAQTQKLHAILTPRYL